MTDTISKTRKLELCGAGVLSLAMVGLIAVVQEFSQAPAVLEDEVARAPDTEFPDFGAIPDVDVKKQQFFDYLEAYIVAENAAVRELRSEIQGYAELIDNGGRLSQRERDKVSELAELYEVDPEINTDRRIIGSLLLRIDTIPISLVLAQAANESAWGTSRFAMEGNNLFGQWCYVKGCGIVPGRRISGATHEVKRFDSVAGAVEAYFLNINSHHLYQEFRDLRARMREQKKMLNSMELAYGLSRYSERGEHYIDEVQTIIEQNQLQQRDRS